MLQDFVSFKVAPGTIMKIRVRVLVNCNNNAVMDDAMFSSLRQGSARIGGSSANLRLITMIHDPGSGLSLSQTKLRKTQSRVETFVDQQQFACLKGFSASARPTEIYKNHMV